MKGKEVEKYIMRDLGFIPRHDCEALAAAITDMAEEINADEQELMELLLNNLLFVLLSYYQVSQLLHASSNFSIIIGCNGDLYSPNIKCLVIL